MADARPGTTGERRPALRIAWALASPVGIAVTIPALVIAVGVGILLVGRGATRKATEQLAHHQLEEQVIGARADVAFALDQASPLLGRLRTLADPERPRDDTLLRLHDLIVGRPGVAYASLSFPDGMFRGAYVARIPGSRETRVEVQESRILAPGKTTVERFTISGGMLVPLRSEQTDYDPRQRDFYKRAVAAGARTWTDPYTFYASHETGITCAEPQIGLDREVRSVLTVDFDVAALSKFIARPAFDQARSIVYTASGTILAYPSVTTMNLPEAAQGSNRLLSRADVRDPAIDALFAAPASPGIELLELATPDGTYLAAVAPIGGQRAGVALPLDWYVATLVPTRTLLGPTKALERSSVVASAGALAIAVGLALVFAWNVVRMRRLLAQSREATRTAEARAVELGSYRLVAKLGSGGMGEVWRAEHRLLARTAAIKLIRPEALHDPASVPEVRERFRREAQTLASMRSRHTIAIYDYGVTEAGVFYYVMELLDGLDLETLVVRDGAQPAARVIRLMTQACASLAEAHDAGLLHRDIKPPNLFACRAADELDVCKLLDFGIVQSVHERDAPAAPSASIAETPRLTQHGAMLGTPGFMAPEQILGMQLDGRADLYALGCCAWWLLVGREVFRRDQSEAALQHAHIYDPVPSLRALVRGWCPLELERVVAACLAKEPEQRPADARALADLLRAIPIPAEHAWTEARMTAWWNAYEAPAPAPSVSSSAVQRIGPGRTEPDRPSRAPRD